MSTRTRCPVCGRDLPTGPNGTRAVCPHCGPAESGAPTSGTDPDATRSAPGESVGLTARSAVLDPAESPDELGRLGPYRLLAELGRGGMGVVYRAEDTHLRRAVAIKMMLPEAAASPAASERFLREARAAAAVPSDHVVPIFHVGEHAGVPFLVMPLLSGEPLDARLRRERVLEPAEAARVGREIAEGLAAAHARGLVHRDIKPANVWLEGDRRRAKLLDFGLALSAGGGDQRLTRTGGVVGTASYMAPEQATGKDVDHRADLFSLGCVLYRMTVGREPFKGRDFISILVAITSEEPVPADRENPALRGAFAALIGELLAKDPARRPPSARAVADRLAAIEQQADPTAADAPSAATPARRRSRGPLVAVLLAGLLAAAGVGVWFATRDHGEKPQPEPDVVKQGGISEDGAGKKIDGSKQSGGDDTKKVGETKVVGVAFHSLPVIAARPFDWDRRGSDPAGFTLSLVGVVGEGRLRHWSPVTAVAFSPDGSSVASGGEDGSVLVWAAGDGRNTAGFAGQPSPVSCLAWAGGQPVSGHRNGRVVVWGPGQPRVLPAHAGPVASVAAAPNGVRVATGGEDGEIRIWEPGFDKPLVLGKHKGPVAVAFAGDADRLVSAGEDGVLIVWSVREKKEVKRLLTGGSLRLVAANPAGTLVATGDGPPGDAVVKLYRTDGLEPRGPAAKHLTQVLALGFSADGKRLLSSGREGSVKVWDVLAEKPVADVPGTWTVAALRPDGNCVAAASAAPGKSGVVTVAELAPSFQPRPVAGPAVLCAALRPDDAVVALGTDADGVVLWDARTGAAAGSLAHPGPVASLAYRGDGAMLASVGFDGVVQVWDPAGSKLLKTFARPTGTPTPPWLRYTQVAFSPNGRVFATPHTKPRTVQLWTTADWQPLTELPCKDPPQAVAFVNDDTLLVGHSDGGVARWGIDAKASRTVREPDLRALRWLVAGPGGRFGVGSVGSDDPQLWDPAREALKSLAEPRQAEGVTFHPDGKRLVVPTADGMVGLGDGKSATLLPVGPRRGVVKQALVTHDRRHLVTVNGNGTAYIVRLESKAP